MKGKRLKFESFVDQKGTLRIPRLLMEGAGSAFFGKEVYIEVYAKEDIRTLDQNAYYFVAIVEPITDRYNELGERFDPDIVHEMLKYRFLRVTRYNPKTGDVETAYVKSTASLSVPEFSFYIEDCIRYAAEDLELVIEPPTKARPEFSFPWYQKAKEKRQAYVTRIGGHLEQLFTEPDLLRYFRQNDDWVEDDEIKGLFRARLEAIRQAEKAKKLPY